MTTTHPDPRFTPANALRPWSRRRFCVGVALGAASVGWLRGVPPMPVGPVRREWTALLQEWTAAMLRQQIHAPGDPARHGALACPACGHIHGRCMDAVYPFLNVARATGDTRFVAAARGVMTWAEANVSQPDGSWTVIANPKSWAGITIFGAIALAEALHHHGDLLDDATRDAWTARLRRAADYVHRTFTIGFTNINYPATAVYGLHLFGTLLNEPTYQTHARELAHGIPAFFTSPHALLLGEGKPSTARSSRGLPAVDLGYNVEESLVALSLYAVDAGDRTLEDQLVTAWRGHLQFMLPDGAWDNSWGTRQAKWSYWGSRTCDGCQPGLAVLVHRDPAFGAAAWRNFELLRACTNDGLLHGGPHYAARGAPPCIHHTFTHAKALATVLDRGDLLDRLRTSEVLPRARQHALTSVPETATWLVARGGWRATVTAYDFTYRVDTRQPTGGVISLLWHEALGPVCAGSMARYVKTEPNNMQDDPDARNDVLTPRLEAEVDGVLYSQLWDTAATVTASSAPDADRIIVSVRLRTEAGNGPESGDLVARLEYAFTATRLQIAVQLAGDWPAHATVRLVWPVIARPEEQVRMVPGSFGRKWRVTRSGGGLGIVSDSELMLPPAPRGRWFSLTPGFCAVPFTLPLSSEGGAKAALSLEFPS